MQKLVERNTFTPRNIAHVSGNCDQSLKSPGGKGGVSGFQRYDKVLWEKQEAYIFGRRTTGYFDLRTVDGQKLHSSAKYTNLKLLESAKTYLITTFGDVSFRTFRFDSRRRASPFLPDLKDGVSLEIQR